MFYTKKPNGYIVTKTKDNSIFEVAGNGFLLVHKRLNVVAFTNSLLQEISPEDGYKKLFKSRDDYDVKIVLNKQVIDNPTDMQLKLAEDQRFSTLYSKLGAELRKNGFERVEDISVFTK